LLKCYKVAGPFGNMVVARPVEESLGVALPVARPIRSE
jgi:hypothetical protein